MFSRYAFLITKNKMHILVFMHSAMSLSLEALNDTVKSEKKQTRLHSMINMVCADQCILCGLLSESMKPEEFNFVE